MLKNQRLPVNFSETTQKCSPDANFEKQKLASKKTNPSDVLSAGYITPCNSYPGQKQRKQKREPQTLVSLKSTHE